MTFRLMNRLIHLIVLGQLVQPKDPHKGKIIFYPDMRSNFNLGNQSFKMIYLTLNLVHHYPTLSRVQQMKLNQMRKMNGL